MTFPNFPQEVVHRDLTILEIELHGRRSFDPHLMFFRALGKSFEPSFYDERGEFIAVYLRENGIDICKSPVGDPAFLPVFAKIDGDRSEEHTSELQSPDHLVC